MYSADSSVEYSPPFLITSLRFLVVFLTVLMQIPVEHLLWILNSFLTNYFQLFCHLILHRVIKEKRSIFTEVILSVFVRSKFL
jgi:hypothetical protein